VKENTMSNRIKNTKVINGVPYMKVQTAKSSHRDDMVKWLNSCPMALKHTPASDVADVIPHVWCPALKDTVSQEKCNGCPMKAQYVLCKDNGTEV